MLPRLLLWFFYKIIVILMKLN